MNIRMWGISLFMFFSTVSAVGQTANRYLKAPLPDEWEESDVGTRKEYYTTDIATIHSKDFPYFSLLIIQPR